MKTVINYCTRKARIIAFNSKPDCQDNFKTQLIAIALQAMCLQIDIKRAIKE